MAALGFLSKLKYSRGDGIAMNCTDSGIIPENTFNLSSKTK